MPRRESHVRRRPSIIHNLGVDARGKYKALEGDTVAFQRAPCAPTATITAEAAVPAAYKSVSFTLPAVTWRRKLWTGRGGSRETAPAGERGERAGRGAGGGRIEPGAQMKQIPPKRVTEPGW
jgi:hypothetical protein